MNDAIEIERKFLVDACPEFTGMISEAVRQGYVTGPDDSVEVRLRQKGHGYFLTVKSVGTVQRAEHETAITAENFETLWPATAGSRIEKTRYIGTLPGGLIFELDTFHGALAPLMLVEVEFATLNAANAFTAPDWFGADVTTDKRFKNRALAHASSDQLIVPAG
jgi:CYTH domain-containing protein